MQAGYQNNYFGNTPVLCFLFVLTVTLIFYSEPPKLSMLIRTKLIGTALELLCKRENEDG